MRKTIIKWVEEYPAVCRILFEKLYVVIGPPYSISILFSSYYMLTAVQLVYGIFNCEHILHQITVQCKILVEEGPSIAWGC